MYSPTTPKPGPNGGPTPTTMELTGAGVKHWTLYIPKPTKKFDPNFQIDTETYEKTAVFMFVADLDPAAAPGSSELTAKLRYQLCSDKECLPPKKVTVSGPLTLQASADKTVEPPKELIQFKSADASVIDTAAPIAAAPPAAGVAASTGKTGNQQDLGSFLLLAFGFGLAAIFTPCVFPMIPITLSFFIGQQGASQAPSRSRSLSQAGVFCLGIMALFTGLGFGLTAVLGPFGVVQLGSNPWVNGFISVVFFAFALSLLGAFEITLPSGLLTKLNQASGQGGYFGVLLMGLTFSLTSFACVGPFVGTLLAASVQGDRLQPALGMLSFSAGLAAPFFLLALFPSYLAKLPRSGGWMARVKIVMGFLILAAMLKYLSNVDVVLGWNILTRERFLALWSVLFALPGLYLLGFLKMEGIRQDDTVTPGRILVGTLLLASALSFIPGMFGARLGELEAYIPQPTEGSGLALGGGAAASSEKGWFKNDYAGALAKAKAENKKLLVAFTGYACTNCHWMKANMFPKPEVTAEMANFVVVELYTDGTDAASEANQQRQNDTFHTVAIPFYAVLDSNEKVLATFGGQTKDTAQFVAFLKTGGPNGNS